MYTEAIGSNNVPAFLSKLWRLVDSSQNELITWSTNGKSFIIRNQARFAKELLPLYFKHNNMASFIRQLNMYGFRKLTHIENTGLRVDNDEIEFYHPHFIRGKENLLEYIKRKQNTLSVANTKSNGSLDDKHNKEDVQLILTDVKEIKNKQDTVNNLLINLQNENEALWKEIATLRHKHQKQQQIVERLIHFLLSLVHSGSIGVKRKLPLMIDNPKNGNKLSDQALENVASNLLNPESGPIIQEITHGLLDDDYDEDVNSPIINSALSETSEPVPQFEDTNDSPVQLVNSTTSSFQPQQQQQQQTYNNQQYDDQQYDDQQYDGQQYNQQTIDNINEVASDTNLNTNLNTNMFDPLQESINAINADNKNLSDDQILNLNDIGSLPIDNNLINQQQQQQLPISATNTNVINTNNPSSSNLKLVLPSTNMDSFSTNSLVPSTSSNVLNTPNITLENFDSHIEDVDSDLYTLQNQLLSGNYNIENDVLMGIFSADDNHDLKNLQSIDQSNSPIDSTNSILSTPLSTPKQIIQPDTNLNNNFDLCDIVDNNGDNLFNQTDLLNSDLNQNQSINKDLNTNYDNLDNVDDLLSTDNEINRLLNTPNIVQNDDQDLYSKDKKRRRIS